MVAWEPGEQKSCSGVLRGLPLLKCHIKVSEAHGQENI